MKIELILVLMVMLISLGIASSGSATANNTIAENISTINESDPVAWFNKGDLLLKSGKYNESIDAYNRAIKLNQSYAIAWSHKGNALLNLTKYNGNYSARL
jgi:tetratricopeptide (TPR) repeat protein